MVDRNRLGFNAFWWGGLDKEDEVKRVVGILAGIGYRSVEWKETSFKNGKDMGDCLSTAVKATNEGGLAVSDAVILRNLSDPEIAAGNVRQVSEFIRCCADAGIGRVNLPPGGRRREYIAAEGRLVTSPSEDIAWATLKQSLESLLAVAERENIYLVLEPIVGQLVRNYHTLMELFEMVDSKYLCLTMDPSHLQVSGDDIPRAIRRFGHEKIGHVHLKDALGKPGVMGEDFLFPLLGEGGIDWNGFFGALDEIGYDGWLCVEFESWKYMDDVLHGDAEEAARLSMKSASMLLENYERYKKKMDGGQKQ